MAKLWTETSRLCDVRGSATIQFVHGEVQSSAFTGNHLDALTYRSQQGKLEKTILLPCPNSSR